MFGGRKKKTLVHENNFGMQMQNQNIVYFIN